MGKITKNFLKNIKYLLRAKSSSLIVIYGPLLLIFLLGVSYDNANFQNIEIGIFSESYSDVTESFIDKLDETEFSTAKMDDKQRCIESVKRGGKHVCVIFPPDMEVSAEQKTQIEFYVDYSKLNLIYSVLEPIHGKIRSQEEEISFDLTSLILQKLKETRQELEDNQQKLENMYANSKEIKDNVEKSKKQLQQVNTDFNTKIFNVENLKTKANQAKSEINNFNNDAAVKLSDAKEDIKDLNNKLEDDVDDIINYADEIVEYMDDHENMSFGSMEDDANDVLELAVDVRDSLEDENISNTDFDTNPNNVRKKLNSLNSALNKLQDTVNSVSERFKDIENVKSAVVSKLGNTNNKLENHIRKVNELQTSFTNMNNNINSISFNQASNIANPVTTKVNPVTAEKTHLNYVFPGLIVLIIMFVTVLLSSTIVSMERSSRAYFRNFITPVKDYVYVIANYFTNLFLISVQLVVIVAIAAAFFSTKVLSSLLGIAVALLLISSMFILIGMLIGYLFKSDETTTLASVIISSILLIFSGLIIPLENMSSWIIKFALYNPFVISENILKQVMLFDTGIMSLWQDLLIMVGICLLLLVLIMLLLKINKRKVFQNYSFHKKKGKKKEKGKKQPKQMNVDLEIDKLKSELKDIKEKN